MFPTGQVLPNRIRQVAASEPDRILMVRADTGEQLTYAAFDRLTERWAAGLHAAGVRPGDAVASILAPGSTAYAAWLGLARLRAVEVPVNIMLTGPLLRHVLADSTARVVLVDAVLLPALAAVLPELPTVSTIVVVGGTADWEHVPAGVRLTAADALLATAGSAHPRLPPEGHDIACLSYTSGTTGPAKGVLVPWAELYEFVAAGVPELGPEDAYYSTYPMFHVSGKHALYTAAAVAGRLVYRTQFSVSEFWSDVRRHGCTAAGLIGPMARMLLSVPEVDHDADNPLRWAAIGPMFPEIGEFARRFGVRIATGYGMTEIGAPLADFGDAVSDWQSCGRPRGDYELRVVDERDEEVEPGIVGELVVRAHRPWMLNAGYFGRGELTARAWRNGWFHTGDAFRRGHAGRYYFVDRLKDAIRRRGENISSFEVEAMVTSLPEVLESVAVPVPSALGEDDVKVVVVLAPGCALGPGELLDRLEPIMPRYMLPRYVEIVDALPKTPTQRVRKVELREHALSHRTWDSETGGYLPDASAGVLSA